MNIIFGIIFGLGIFCIGAFLIWYLILFFFIFFMGGSVLLYYIILVLMSLRSISGFKGKNLFDKIWVFSFGEVVGGLFKGCNFGS